MNDNMPQMPGLPTPTHSQPASSAGSTEPVLSPSFAEGSAGDAAGPANEELNKLPEIANIKPSLHDPMKSANVIPVAPVAVKPQRGIEVVAIDKGFYNQNRKFMGDEFTIRSEEEFGEWFRCKDPNIEQRRIEFLKDKKVKLRK